MKKTVLIISKITLVLLVSVSFIPMPHGGTIGGNIVEGILYEVRIYLSPESKEARKQEKENWMLQKEEARKSWKELETKY